MSPFPSWSVIPDGWAAHHRPTTNSTMQTAAQIIRVTGPEPYPRPPGWQAHEVLWETKVRVQALDNATRESDAGEQLSTIRRYLVTAPVEGAPAIRLGATADQVLVLGRRLRVVDIAPGTYLWEVDLICEENLTQSGPVDLTPQEVP